jgi:hypothetical protein
MLGCSDYTPWFFTSNPEVFARYILLDTSSQAFAKWSLAAQIGLYAPTIIDWCHATGVGPASVEQPHFELTQNYPNPFNPRTQIRYTLERDGGVRLTVHDLLGRLVLVLVNETQETGSHVVSFDAGELPSGTYFYTLQSGERVHTKRMVVVR